MITEEKTTTTKIYNAHIVSAKVQVTDKVFKDWVALGRKLGFLANACKLYVGTLFNI